MADPFQDVDAAGEEFISAFADSMDERQSDPTMEKIVSAYLGKLAFSEDSLTIDVGCGAGAVKAADMVLPAMVSAVGARPGSKALDLCCGQGNVTAALCKAGAQVIGLDSSPAMLEMARVEVPEAKFVEGDAMSLSFEDETIDVVTIGFGMPHVPDPPRVLAEARRVLRTGGKLAFSVWCGPEVDTALGYVFGAIGQHGSPDIALPPGPGANDYADPEIAFPVLEKAGFRDFQQVIVASKWHVTDPGAPYDYFLKGTARGGALLRPQPATHAAAIRAAVVDKVLEKHGSGPKWEVPIPAAMTVATAD